MPTRWVIKGLTGIDDIDGCALTEMHLVAHREGIVYSVSDNRDVMVAKLKEVGLIWEEETPEEVLRKNEEIRAHFSGSPKYS